MPKEELITGLKNAIVRGESLEKAIQSLLSAGYNSQEVHEAADTINMGVIGEVSKQAIKNEPLKSQMAEIKPLYKPLPIIAQQQTLSSVTAQTPAIKTNHKIPSWLIGLLIFFGFLIIFIILLSIFGESILSALFK